MSPHQNKIHSMLKQEYEADDGHENPKRYRRYLRQLFGDVDLKGLRILEIGSGKGLISLHCGLAGAKHVISVEPEMEGSTSGVIAIQKERIKSLSLENVELRQQDFNSLDVAGGSIDLIVMIAVLNHLHETPHNASRNADAFDKYVAIAKKLHSLLDEGGSVVATDACRYCLWTQLRRVGWPRKWCLTQRTIDWKIHQQPAVWEKIFLAAGFSRFEVKYPVPNRLRYLEPLVNNSIGNFAVMGEFIFYAYK
ncbi:class I SAM-dependent methyltransferase [Rubripirellula reticaptiva]|uniref:Methyltransferase domain protein n=1 Tax=Rubripirellula reticaptiva TaxID=2528013 RepID=A0A5C6F5J7_9BACT|nr:methyltransferase domain-containing protein [Rubripirellula reticaptiva]TWU55687.1 Methyltransferase domain protein [Rubripirellula reticaptiva]